RFEVYEMGRLGIDQEAGRDREGCALRVLRQSADAERTADPHRPPEDAGGKLRKSRQLARAAGEHDTRAWLGGERRAGKAIAHHFEDFLDARLDDSREARP